jgi:hypothetical protein
MGCEAIILHYGSIPAIAKSSSTHSSLKHVGLNHCISMPLSDFFYHRKREVSFSAAGLAGTSPWRFLPSLVTVGFVLNQISLPVFIFQISTGAE